MTAVASIPNELYVTLKYREDAGNQDGLLGFASPYTKDASFKKRKATQDVWAYGHGAKVIIDDDDNSITMTTSPNAKLQITEIFVANWYPRVIKNELLEGFEIAKSVRRQGWSGSGNVAWRITDPRGFDLEISSENFASLVSSCDLEKGRILGKCAWGRLGANNILLHEESEPYQLAMKKTQQLKSKLPISSAQPGDIVEVISNTQVGKPVMYMGKYYLLVNNAMTDRHSNGNWVTQLTIPLISPKQVVTHVFKSLSSDQFYAYSSPKISDQIQKADTPLDCEEFAKASMLISAEERSNRFDNRPDIILVSTSKIDTDKITSKLVPVEVSTADWPKIGYYRKMILARRAGAMYLTSLDDYGSYYRRTNKNSPTIKQIPVDTNLETNSLTFIDCGMHSRSSQCSIGQDNSAVKLSITINDTIADYEFFDIEMTIDGNTYIWNKEVIF